MDNLPSHTHSVSTASHSHSQPSHTHGTGSYISTLNSGGTWKVIRLSDNGSISGGVKSLSSGGETTGSASPVTSIGSTGNGQAFNITPSYYTVHMWLRLT